MGRREGRKLQPSPRSSPNGPKEEAPGPRSPEEGTYLAGGSCGVSGRVLAAVLSLAALLLRKLGGPSAERRGAGLEFWGSNSSSGITSSQRAPRKPERHTQSWGRLQEPLFWQGGWHTARETGRGVRAGARGRHHLSEGPLEASLAPLLFPSTCRPQGGFACHLWTTED